MPLQRRLPKFGFRSKLAKFSAEIRLHQLNKINSDKINLEILRQEKLISPKIKSVKIILAGKLEKSFIIEADILVTKGAKEAILSAGGKIESTDGA